jgi:hypothetical protein
VNYTKVDIPQIAEVGFGEGQYGPETFGLKFPPNKRQAAAGESGSEYHYGNVPPRMHRAMLKADDIYAYFNENIKKHPDLYPYTKVEASTIHVSEVRDWTEADMEAMKSTPPNPTLKFAHCSTEHDSPSPSIALAVIDTLAPEVIFAPGNVDSILVKLREQVLAMAKGLDPSTPEKQKRIRAVKGLVASQRIFVEKARKGYVADLVAKKGLTDKVSNAIQGRLSDIESEILEVTGYAAWEQGEKEFESRMTGLQNRLANMGKEMFSYTGRVAIEAAIKELEEFDTSNTREHKQAIEIAIESSLRVLKPELARRQEAERNAAELAELRRKQAEREEADRRAEAKRQEDARIAAAVEAAKVETRQEVLAEVELIRGDDLVDVGAEPEDSPELVQATRIDPETIDHKQAIHAKVVEAFMGYSLTRQQSITVLQAIVDGKVPHVSITY